MATVNVYLPYYGNCEEAFNFYKSDFGGEFPLLVRYKDMPQDENYEPVSDLDSNKIMHVTCL